MQPIAGDLRTARLGHALVEAVPGTALEVRAGEAVAVVAGPGDPRGTVLPCQHRGALASSLAGGSLDPYLAGVALRPGAALAWQLLTPPGTDLGTGVLATEHDGLRRLVTATTLCAHHAVRAARAAQTVPVVVRCADDRDRRDLGAALSDLRVEAHHDPVLGTTVLAWSHRPHPTVVGPVEDAVRAAAAACVVEELLLDVRARG